MDIKVPYPIIHSQCLFLVCKARNVPWKKCFEIHNINGDLFKQIVLVNSSYEYINFLNYLHYLNNCSPTPKVKLFPVARCMITAHLEPLLLLWLCRMKLMQIKFTLNEVYAKGFYLGTRSINFLHQGLNIIIL